MAAALQTSTSRARPRAASNPFSDPLQRAPQPPPKAPSRPPKMSSASRSAQQAHPHTSIVEAVRDTVVVRDSPRSRVGRSQTAGSSPAPQPTNTRPQPIGRRSQSEDSVLQAAAALERAKTNGKSRASKKGSRHADVIDRLDFTGVGPMFHHDGPFDACAPSRNRHSGKAPMLAWTGNGPYPPIENYIPADPPNKKVDAIAEAWGIHEPEPYEEFFAGGGKAGDDNTPAGSIHAGKEGYSNDSPRNSTGKRFKDGQDLQEVPRNYLEEDSQTPPTRRATRRALPPPQPIFTPEGNMPLTEEPLPSQPSNSPKRSKSIMNRIRRMRDSPNVPVDHQGAYPPSPVYDNPPSPSENTHPGRPGHKHQNLFLGKFNGGPTLRRSQDDVSPTSDVSERFVYVDAVRGSKDSQRKELPPTPLSSGNVNTPDDKTEGYYDDVAASPPSSGGELGRKASLLRRVGRAVRVGKY